MQGRYDPSAVTTILALSVPLRTRYRLRQVLHGYRITISMRSSDAEDASASLQSIDDVSLDGAIHRLQDLVLSNFMAGVVPRDERFSAATAALHSGRPGMRPQSVAARRLLESSAAELLEFCHGYARAFRSLRLFAVTNRVTVPDLPDHPLLRHAMEDVENELADAVTTDAARQSGSQVP